VVVTCGAFESPPRFHRNDGHETDRVGTQPMVHLRRLRDAASASAGLLVVYRVGLFRMELFRIKQQ
jgi:hypothetical protein